MTTTAPLPPTCQGPTDWPPQTRWQRYMAQRSEGTAVPPSVAAWTERDRLRQARAHADRGAQRPTALMSAPWGGWGGCGDE